MISNQDRPQNFLDLEASPSALEAVPEVTKLEKLTAVMSTVAIVSAVISMVVEGSILVYIAGGLSMMVAPYAVYQQRQLTDIQALQETYDQMNKEVNTLHKKNDSLQNELKTMEGSVERLEDIEGAMDMLTTTQGQNVQVFKNQVEENRKILQGMEKNLKTSVLQNLMTVIIRCDTDGDFTVDSEDIESLVSRLKQINGIHIDEQKFRAVIDSSDGKVDALILMIKELLEAENSKIPTSDRIFFFDEE